jgi:phosphoribosylamine--glycine ligase
VAAQGYPLQPRKGDLITALPPEAPDAVVFHAGTALQEQGLVTSGGRVMCLTTLADSTRLA